jgi:RNA polymerase sigma-70 factor (ECF subfamily)
LIINDLLFHRQGGTGSAAAPPACLQRKPGGRIPALTTPSGMTSSSEACLSPCREVAYSQAMSDLTEDSALMLRYCAGDVAAFELLYERHKDGLYRYLLRLTLDRHTAEDVFQDAWGKIIRSRSNYRPTAKFSTFLYRVAHNCFIDSTRRNRRHRQAATTDPEQLEAPGVSPDELTEKSLLRRRILDLVRALPQEQRDVFLLHEEGGLGLDEIALITGANRETVKSRLRYAMTKLKSGLAENPEADQ